MIYCENQDTAENNNNIRLHSCAPIMCTWKCTVVISALTMLFPICKYSCDLCLYFQLLNIVENIYRFTEN